MVVRHTCLARSDMDANLWEEIMKINDLIEMLQKQNPEHEIGCDVGDILHIPESITTIRIGNANKIVPADKPKRAPLSFDGHRMRII
jgi:hypothetical protein